MPAWSMPMIASLQYVLCPYSPKPQPAQPEIYRTQRQEKIVNARAQASAPVPFSI
jgi:hypothetical protein